MKRPVATAGAHDAALHESDLGCFCTGVLREREGLTQGGLPRKADKIGGHIRTTDWVRDFINNLLIYTSNPDCCQALKTLCPTKMKTCLLRDLEGLSRLENILVVTVSGDRKIVSNRTSIKGELTQRSGIRYSPPWTFRWKSGGEPFSNSFTNSVSEERVYGR